MAKQCQTNFANQRKELLENSLRDLMLVKNYNDISVSDICAAAGIPRRTFYHYFENKEDTLASLIDNIMLFCYLEIMFDVYDEAEKMKESFACVFRFWQGEKRKALDALIKNGLETKLMAHALKMIQAEKIGFQKFSSLDPKLVEIGLMVGVTEFFTLLFYWSRNGYGESPENMAEYAVSLLPRAFYK